MLQYEDGMAEQAGSEGLYPSCHQPPLSSDVDVAHMTLALQPSPRTQHSDTLPLISEPYQQHSLNPFSPHEMNSNVDLSSHQHDARALDNEGKMHGDTSTEELRVPRENNAYSSDSGSDVYMNSDYTDTIDSSASETCLLKDDSSSDGNAQSDDCLLRDRWPDADKAPAAYTNQVFSEEGNTDPAPVPCEDHKKTVHDINDTETAEDHTQFVAEHQSANSRCLADEEDEDEDGEDVPLQKDTALESLVHQLAEHHPSEMVSITVNEVDAPDYETSSESLYLAHKPVPGCLRVPFQGGLLHSTESLNAYKLSKQGHSNATNSLRVQAINNWRAKTMDNIHVRNSFQNLASASVNNMGQVCRKALSYIRTDMEFSSRLSLGGCGGKPPSILTVSDGESPSDEDSSAKDDPHQGVPSVASGRHMRNVLLMALLITIFFVANFATRNLQSSLNQDGAVGVFSLAVMFVFYILGSLLSPVLVQGLGVKRVIVVGLMFQLFYVAANLYPAMWLMIPASMGGGASLTTIWNAMSTYVVMLARGESRVTGKPYERVSDRFFGIFCLIYQSNLVIGNLIAALVLSYGDSVVDSSAVAVVNDIAQNATVANYSLLYRENLPSENVSHEMSTVFLDLTEEVLLTRNGSSTAGTLNTSEGSPVDICGADFCHHYEITTGAASVTQFTIFLLFGTFMLLLVICIFIAWCLLEPLSPHLFTSTASPWRRVKDQMVALAKFSRNRKFQLLFPLMLYSVMQYSFVSSEITVAFMTCPIGVWMVGYCMMLYGANCSISSYVCQAFIARVGRGFFIGLAAVINLGLLVTLRFWKPQADSLVPMLIISSLFGFADGIWNFSVNGMCGSVFPDNFEEAFSGLRIAQGIGGAFNMAYSPFFCLTVKIYVVMGIVVTVFVGYVGAEVLIRREEREKRAAGVLGEKDEVVVVPEKA
ncbi:uncharacterized protein LOC143288026 [Babylonia areolata]|uniref:uncharacterized protein LOC143288026 n=1 Tax=Babylonia areolata TaxID=304850 RepID=UPI003FD25C30